MINKKPAFFFIPFLNLFFLLTIIAISGCATPQATIDSKKLNVSQEKIPLTAAVIFSTERQAKVWQPAATLQGGVPRPVHPGRVLAKTLKDSMELVFDRIVVVENVEEAQRVNADIYTTAKYEIAAPLGLSTLMTVTVAVTLSDTAHNNLFSAQDNGTYNHFWTAIDDGAVQRAYVGALKKIIPKMAKSPAIKQYASNISAGIKTTALARPAVKPDMPGTKSNAIVSFSSPNEFADAEPYLGPKKRIAVTNFANAVRAITGSRHLGQGFSEMLITSLIKSDRFVVVERQALQDILGEQALGQTGVIRNETAAKVGQVLGAQIIVRGVVSEFELKESGGGGDVKIKGFLIGAKTSNAHIAVDIRLIDATTGQVLASHNASGKAQSSALKFGVSNSDFDFTAAGFNKTPLGQATRQAINSAVRFIISKMEHMPFTAKVIKSKGSSIYINAGSLMNIRPGNLLFAYSKGQEITDPDTGVSLGSEEKLVGTVEVKDVKDKYSIGRLISGKGRLKRGDILKFR